MQGEGESGWETAAAPTQAPAGAPGLDLLTLSLPGVLAGRLQGNLGRHTWLRAAGKGGDKAVFFPAPNGEEMTFLLHKLDFLQLEKNIL